ncbi:acyl carrier protein [Paenibacillus sp. N3/727]|uniref:acyl carrier protein n=1 Tax=Paenibacillus sp. N3/727 TaxID=2925845 RepID=UPI001F535D11|nr:acyl carrier protein [Paenibacillus sp. N3/727]UNK18922.1 acyl carrier protein [Paenibacillus sp. N3/727]
METMQTEQHIQSFLKGRICELLERPELSDELTINTQLSEVGMDSVMLVNLMVHIEQHYQIFYEDDELLEENFATIQIISEKIQEKLGLGD